LRVLGEVSLREDREKMVGTVDEGAVERRDALEKAVVCRERVHGLPVTEL